MPFADTLNTNQIRNAAGAEVEFQHLLTGPGRVKVYAQTGETPSLRHRFTIQHREVGTGLRTVRQSNLKIDKDVVSQVNAVDTARITVSLRLDAPIGHLTSTTELANVLAEMATALATKGDVGATLLTDGTGYGAAALINGSF